MGTKFKPLLRTDFSESESERFSGIVTTVSRFICDEWLAIWGPISWSSFWGLNLVQMIEKFRISFLNFGISAL